MTHHLFPFDKVPKGSRIVLYGAGNVGKQFYNQIVETNFCEIVLWLDKNADGILTKKPEAIASLGADDYDFVVIGIESEVIVLEVKDFLVSHGVLEEKILHEVDMIPSLMSEVLNYKTYNNLINDIKVNIHKIPRDIDLVVGIPRSGMIPAYMIGLLLNKKVCSLDEFIDGIDKKSLTTVRVKFNTESIRKILVLDDSVNGGNAQKIAKKHIEESGLNKKYQILYGAIYYVPDAYNKVDIALVKLSPPRMFQWNYLNHSYLQYACFDIDGLLCEDPTEEQNDDGEKYIDFLLNARPLYIPNYKIFALVTSRLEKYRSQTEQWLKVHNVEYEHLFMLDLPSKEERIKLRMHGKFKAKIYSQLKNTFLFYESEQRQAQEIAQLTGKKVFCTSTDELFEYSSVMAAEHCLMPYTSNKKCLEIGPGLERIPGFETINVIKTPVTDYVLDLSKEDFPFADNSWDIIFTSHFFEHIEWFRVEYCLREVFRILKPSGYLDLYVPDGYKLASIIVDAEDGKIQKTPDGWKIFNEQDNPFIWANGRLFYGANPNYPSWHKSVFTFEYLKWLFEKNGFKNIERLNDDQTLGVRHGWINLGIRGYK
ncbi:MAG: methyltransferase domain-containing protein [Fibromonadaceae bacterium]|jgi:uncharacterized HAD superfamily protein/hypoxanthine phosphoribosyltransferase|nr:methyltransferase domain-containing protein [Fibromonadaceae bacterium]